MAEVNEQTKNRIKEICEHCKGIPNVPVQLFLGNGVTKSNFFHSVEIVYLKDFEYFSIKYEITEDKTNATLSFLSVTAQTSEDIYNYCKKHEHITFEITERP